MAFFGRALAPAPAPLCRLPPCLEFPSSAAAAAAVKLQTKAMFEHVCNLGCDRLFIYRISDQKIK